MTSSPSSWCLGPSLEGETQTASLVSCYFNWKNISAFLCPILHLAQSWILQNPSCLSAVSSHLLPFYVHAPLHRLLCINISLKCRNTNKGATSFTSRSTGCLSAPLNSVHLSCSRESPMASSYFSKRTRASSGYRDTSATMDKCQKNWQIESHSTLNLCPRSGCISTQGKRGLLDVMCTLPAC